MNKFKINKNNIVYYPRCMNGHFNICELKIRTVEDDWFVGVDKRDKHAYLFGNKDIDIKVFANRKDALEIVKREEEKYRETHIEEEDYDY